MENHLKPSIQIFFSLKVKCLLVFELERNVPKAWTCMNKGSIGMGELHDANQIFFEASRSILIIGVEDKEEVISK